MSNTIHSGFIGSFNLGDNIVYNLKILSDLYCLQAGATEPQKMYLRKPIILLIGSVAEALLHDLFFRINRHTNEGVANIPEQVSKEIQGKNADRFATYIDVARSKSLLGQGQNIYEALHELRRLRNRVHIQDVCKHLERKEFDIFTDERQTKAQATLEYVMLFMEKNYVRKGKDFVESFTLPWERHVTLD